MNNIDIVAGSANACARKTDGTVWCWGDNDQGQLGLGSVTAYKLSAIPLAAFGSTTVQAAIGNVDVCVRKADGTLWCAGYNVQGEIGIGTTASPKASPLQVVALGTNVIDVSIGEFHVCAGKADDTLWC